MLRTTMDGRRKCLGDCCRRSAPRAPGNIYRRHDRMATIAIGAAPRVVRILVRQDVK